MGSHSENDWGPEKNLRTPPAALGWFVLLSLFGPGRRITNGEDASTGPSRVPSFEEVWIAKLLLVSVTVAGFWG